MALIKCVCEHSFQDYFYGNRIRVANFSIKSNNGQGGWRCTVCERVHQKAIDGGYLVKRKNGRMYHGNS